MELEKSPSWDNHNSKKFFGADHLFDEGFPKNRVAVCEIHLRNGERLYAVPAVYFPGDGILEFWHAREVLYHKSDIRAWREISLEELKVYQKTLPNEVVIRWCKNKEEKVSVASN